jgi:hypothetical protein
MTCIIGKRYPMRRLPKALTAAATTMAVTAAMTAVTTTETLAMATLSKCI